MIVIPDSNTLIYLAKADILELINRYEVWVGDKVYTETVERGKEEGRSDAFILEKYIEENFKRKSLEDEEKFQKEKEYFKGGGETEVFLLAEGKDCLVITSDLVAKRKLQSRRINVIRSDMLLYKNFRDGIFDMEEFNRKLMKLRDVSGTTDKRITFLMNKAEKIERRGENYE